MIAGKSDPQGIASGRRVRFFGVPVDILGLAETVALAEQAMEQRVLLRQTSLNVAKLVKLGRDPELERHVSASELVSIDGTGIAWGLRLFGITDAARVTGIDLFLALLGHCAQNGRRPFILGSTPEILARAIDEARRRHPGLELAGSHHGYFGADGEPAVVEQIRQSRADCLFVALPSPAKEAFIHRHAETMEVPFVMGIGGSLDVLAGAIPRAPVWMQRIGLEWYFRLLQEPRRLLWRYASTNTSYAIRLGKALVYRQDPIERAPVDALSSP